MRAKFTMNVQPVSLGMIHELFFVLTRIFLARKTINIELICISMQKTLHTLKDDILF